MSKRKAYLVAVLSLALSHASSPAPAADRFPDHAVELLVPFAPGGPADIAARVIQPHLSSQLGVPVLIVNKPGAGGAVAMEMVSRAKPDGYTLAATTNSTLVTVPAVNPNVSYKTSDFAAVGTYAVDYQAIISRPDTRWKTIEEFIAYARKNPGKVTYGSSGTGGISYFNMEIMKMVEKLDITHVPYQGTGPVKNAILGGHVDVATSAMGAFQPLVKANSVVFLITTAPKRLPEMPDVPTMLEKGFNAATLNTVMLLVAPAKAPNEALQRLRAALAKVMQEHSMGPAMEKAGLRADFQGPDATMRAIEGEITGVQSVVKTLKIN